MENIADIQINTLADLIKKLPDERSCREYFEYQRWGTNPVCPFCGGEKHYKFKSKEGDRHNRYKCADRHCGTKFNCLTGTIFENTKIPMIEWFKAIYLMTCHKKGLSSYQLARDLGVTQKTAWFMSHRIREMLREKAPQMLSNTVEADETYIGGKVANKHKWERDKIASGESNKGKKAPVVGIVERGGNIALTPVENTDGDSLKHSIFKHVKMDSIVITDGHIGYTDLNKVYKKHYVVNHSLGEFAKGTNHTNTIEGAFSLLKRGIYGIYHQVSKKHLGKYCHEFSFRYNTRQDTQAKRFAMALAQGDTRLKYGKLVGKEVKQ